MDKFVVKTPRINAPVITPVTTIPHDESESSIAIEVSCISYV